MNGTTMNGTLNGTIDEEMTKRDFIHFNSIGECSEFVKLLGENDIEVIHSCCGGKGCCIKKTDVSVVENLKLNFEIKE